MKKIFILTGEPSGDKLAAKVISKLKIKDPNITYLCLGGEELKSLGINSISKLSEVTYLGFTRVLLNLFKINRKINETAQKILEFNPDILFSSAASLIRVFLATLYSTSALKNSLRSFVRSPTFNP